DSRDASVEGGCDEQNRRCQCTGDAQMYKPVPESSGLLEIRPLFRRSHSTPLWLSIFYRVPTATLFLRRTICEPGPRVNFLYRSEHATDIVVLDKREGGPPPPRLFSSVHFRMLSSLVLQVLILNRRRTY